MNSENHHPDPVAARPDALPADWASLEEFLKWGSEKPNAVRHLELVARRIELGELEEFPPEVRATAGRFTVLRRQQVALTASKTKAVEIMQVIQAPAGDYSVNERIERVKALFDELSDVLLSVPEPHRTRFFGQLSPLRERLQAMEPEEE